eukprot:12903856-Prorocentrum_lima.AAC.1
MGSTKSTTVAACCSGSKNESSRTAWIDLQGQGKVGNEVCSWTTISYSTHGDQAPIYLRG